MSDDNSEPPEKTLPVLGWHRVCLNTIVRATKDLESARLRILPMGSRVNVVEVSGRRVRIDEPIGGWCSIESSNGDLILSPTDDNKGDEDHGLAGVGAADQGRVEALTKELQELKTLREEVKAKNMDEILDKLQKSSAEVQELKSKVSDVKKEASKKEKATRELAELNRKIKEAEVLMKNYTREQASVNKEIQQTADQYTSSVNDVFNDNTHLQNGDVVMMQSKDGFNEMVIVRYVGKVSWDDSGADWLGCELSFRHEDGNNGHVQGVAYFMCADKHGMFYPRSRVKKKIPAEALLQMLHAKVGEHHLQQSDQPAVQE